MKLMILWKCERFDLQHELGMKLLEIIRFSESEKLSKTSWGWAGPSSTKIEFDVETKWFKSR